MNLPNKLTLFRMILIPFFVVFMLSNFAGDASKWIALGIFIVASLTDLLDGKIARKYNLVTNFGKFMDPLADKLLVCTAMLCLIPKQADNAYFAHMDMIFLIVVITIIAREFIISGFRLVASDNGRVLAASYWGKFKTTFQMIMVCFMIADIQVKGVQIFTFVIMWIALALTIISLLDYLIKNWDVVGEQK